MINLLPPSVRRDVRYAKYNVILVQYVAVVFITVLIVVTLMMFGRNTLTNTKSDIEAIIKTDRAEAAQLESINTEAQELSDSIDTISTILDQEVKFSLLLKEIGSVMPSGAKLSALALSTDASQPVRLTVDLVNEERAGVLQQNLVESRLFIGADIINVTQANSDPNYPFAGDLQAYYDPNFPLNSLDDPPKDEAPAQHAVPEESNDPPPQDSGSSDANNADQGDSGGGNL